MLNDVFDSYFTFAFEATTTMSVPQLIDVAMEWEQIAMINVCMHEGGEFQFFFHKLF
jgi:hypothetical protein